MLAATGSFVLPVVLEFNPQPARQTVDIIVIGNDLRNIEDFGIAESGIAQLGNVTLFHIAWVSSQLLCELQHVDVLFRDIRSMEVSLHRLDQGPVLGYLKETSSMMGHSVVASIDLGDDNGDHFALYTTQS